MKQECDSVCSDTSVTLGPVNVSDNLIAAFLGPQFTRPYIQSFVSNLQPVWRELGNLLPISVSDPFTFWKFCINFITCCIEDFYTNFGYAQRASDDEAPLHTNTGARVRFSRACFCYEYEIRLNVYIYTRSQKLNIKWLLKLSEAALYKYDRLKNRKFKWTVIMMSGVAKVWYKPFKSFSCYSCNESFIPSRIPDLS